MLCSMHVRIKKALIKSALVVTLVVLFANHMQEMHMLLILIKDIVNHFIT